MCKKAGEKDMKDFKEFLKANKEKIRNITESNTVRNKDGVPVITKDDPWRNETEWDSLYKGFNFTK
jgi:hypothetical protein